METSEPKYFTFLDMLTNCNIILQHILVLTYMLWDVMFMHYSACVVYLSDQAVV